MKCEEIDSLQGLIMRMTHLYYGKAYAAMKELDVHPRQIPLLFILQKKEGMSHFRVDHCIAGLEAEGNLR